MYVLFFKTETAYELGISGWRLEGCSFEFYKLSEFMNQLPEEDGKPVLGYKGVVNISGESRRLVFQGVLKLYCFDWDTEWAPDEARESVIVFIADELPEEKIRAGFEAALL